MVTKPLAPRNWKLNKSKEKPSTIHLSHGAYPGPAPLDRPTRRMLEERKAKITLPKLKFMDD